MAKRRSIDWMREKLKLPISDLSEPLISVSDIKQYIYCPRTVYFEKVLHAKPMLDSQQEDSKEMHEEYVRKEMRRRNGIFYSPEFVDSIKMPFLHFCSKKLDLKGTIDLIIRTRTGEYVPVDYKNMNSNNGRVWMHHKYQLAAYALLIEDHFNTLVRRGFINYIPEDIIIKLDISYSVKKYTIRIMRAIKRTVIEEVLPPKKSVECLGGCGYKRICQNSF